MDLEQPLAGQRLGAYTVLSLLGGGGTGVVYRARDEKLGREVAMKILHAGLLADAAQRSRFQREARALAALNHQNIGAIYAIEEIDGASALVLELVDGPTLAEQLERGPLPVDEALKLARQIADALNAAHRHGIVHRDLKPANIKITEHSHAKLLDFGIATQASSQPTTTGSLPLTVTGQVLGTAQYMSPEQVRGAAVDSRSDQFSFGIVLFEMLTGRQPFTRGNAAETMAAIMWDPPPALGAIDSSIPAPLQSIVYRCLAKEPTGRYASTSDLVTDLATLGSRVVEPQLVAGASGRVALPAPRTPLIGREAELEAVQSLLLRDDVRMVTLTGTGGAGKTRLAIGAASELVQNFGGVYFVPLAPITDPALVAPAIAKVIGVGETPDRDASEILKETLRAAREPMLLLLDNFEQLVAAAPVLTDLLESCAKLKLLVTSRAVLRVYGEHAFEVPALRLPAPGTASLAKIARAPAVALLVQRAAAVKQDFRLTPENAAAVTTICAKLDGIPLAIELAAARLRTLTPAAMLERLESRFELLTGGARDLPARQQTLRATVEWSFGLLTPNEQKLFRRLAVFVNGGTLEATEAVCNPMSDLGASVLDAMESLIDQSLIQKFEPASGETRFSMLETIRDYALERLAASPDEALTRKAHAAYCLVLAEEGQMAGTTQGAVWMERCDRELANFRSALDWAVRTGNAEWGLRIGAGLLPFWHAREHYREGRDRLAALLPARAGAAPRTQTRALHAAGVLDYELGELHAGREKHAESVALNKRLGDTAGQLSSINALAATEMALGNLEQARELFAECAALSLKTGDLAHHGHYLMNVAQTLKEQGDFMEAKRVGQQALESAVAQQDSARVAFFQSVLGDIERALGDRVAARACYESALTAFERLGDRSSVARTKIDLAALVFEQGEERNAHEILGVALMSFRDLGNRRGLARAIDELAFFALHQGRPERALRLGGAALAIRRAVGASLHNSERTTLEKRLDVARMHLGAEAAAPEAEGRSMTIESAVDYALRVARGATRS